MYVQKAQSAIARKSKEDENQNLQDPKGDFPLSNGGIFYVHERYIFYVIFSHVKSGEKALR